MYEGLTRIGYQCVKPQGAFYVFRDAIDDDVAFVRRWPRKACSPVPGPASACPATSHLAHGRARHVVRRAAWLRGAFRKARGRRLTCRPRHGHGRAGRVGGHVDARHLRAACFSLVTGHHHRCEHRRRVSDGLPSIIAVILNYVKRSGGAGTWLASHFRWQIPRSGSGYCGWRSACSSCGHARRRPADPCFPSACRAVVHLRVVSGWLRLKDRRPMYV